MPPLQDEPDEPAETLTARASRGNQLLFGDEPEENAPVPVGKDKQVLFADEPDEEDPIKQRSDPALPSSSLSDGELAGDEGSDVGLEGSDGDIADSAEVKHRAVFDMSWQTMSMFLSSDLIKHRPDANPPPKKRRYNNTKRAAKAAAAAALNSAANDTNQPRKSRNDPETRLNLGVLLMIVPC